MEVSATERIYTKENDTEGDRKRKETDGIRKGK